MYASVFLLFQVFDRVRGMVTSFVPTRAFNVQTSVDFFFRFQTERARDGRDRSVMVRVRQNLIG